MAGGPIAPDSIYLGAGAGTLFPNFYSGAGGNSAPVEEGIGVIASLVSQTAAYLRFPMPPAIPSGTMKLLIRCLANASTGTVKITPADGTCGSGSSPSAVSLTTDAQASLTWGAGDADKYKDAKIALSSVPSPNDSLVVQLAFNNTGWTLAVILTLRVWVLWE
jgi:hypothetical protein